MLNLKHNQLLLKMPFICKFMSFAKTGAPLEHTKKDFIWYHGCKLTPKQRKCILWMLSKIVNASIEFICWLSISHLTAFCCPDLAVSGRYWVFFRRQLHNNYAVYWIFKALSRHKSVGCKRRYGKYCLFYTVQACKFVTARFRYRANWTRVGKKTTVLIQTSVCYIRSFTQLTKPISAGLSIPRHFI